VARGRRSGKGIAQHSDADAIGRARMLTAAWILLALCLVAAAFRQRYLFSPTAMFFAYCALVFPISFLLPTWFSIPSIFFEFPGDEPDGEVWFAYFVVLVSLATFCVFRFGLPVPQVQWPAIEIDTYRVKWFLAFSVPLAVLSGILLINSLGGFDDINGALNAGRAGGLTGQGIPLYVVTMLCPTLMQFWLMGAIQQKSRHAGLLFVCTLLASVMGALLGFRGPAIALVIQTLAIWHLMRGGIHRNTMLAILASAVLVVTVSGLMRNVRNAFDLIESGAIDPSTAAAFAADSAITRVRGVQSFILMRQYVDTHGYDYFMSNLWNTFVGPIPGALIDKGPSLSEVIATNVYGDFFFESGLIRDLYGGVSYTYISEGYWNLGVLGAMVFAGVWGALLRSIEAVRTGVAFTTSQLIVYKAIAGFTLQYVESPQLGINAIVANIVLNVVLMAVLNSRLRFVWSAAPIRRSSAQGMESGEVSTR
jgi:hypothetical protein